MSVEMKCGFIGPKDFLKLQCSITELSSYSSCKCASVHCVILAQFLSYNHKKWLEVKITICNSAEGVFRQPTIVSSARLLWVISKWLPNLLDICLSSCSPWPPLVFFVLVWKGMLIVKFIHKTLYNAIRRRFTCWNVGRKHVSPVCFFHTHLDHLKTFQHQMFSLLEETFPSQVCNKNE